MAKLPDLDLSEEPDEFTEDYVNYSDVDIAESDLGGGFENSIEIQELDAEISSLDAQIQDLCLLRDSLVERRKNIATKSLTPKAPKASRPFGKTEGFDYFTTKFPWHDQIHKLAKAVWGINAFRLAQEGAINAALDQRDLICVMPTGGGKSLIYQLPALLNSGVTLVVTPLISLMQDQTYNLNRVGVRAEMLHAATTREENKAICTQMISQANSQKGKSNPSTRPIKLVYVTPERIDKAKSFVSTLQKMYDNGNLARVVIDEAHCTASNGHDYRPSYLALGKLKSLFPTVPISALTATAPDAVVKEMIKILQMPRKTSFGTAAVPGTTLLFTSPLYRCNLRYSVVPKPKDAAGTIAAMLNFILTKHKGEKGIIYCLSRADSESVCKALNASSGKSLICEVYHSSIHDQDKLAIHKAWRDGSVHCVVATTAFGLGIDAPDVRYVLHHSPSQSLEGYYQESGRAGRDGNPADCVIFYRAIDSGRLSSLLVQNFFAGAREKLYGMLSYCEDLTQCRKKTFSNYFALSHESDTAFEETREDKRCNNCDNCSRNSDFIHLVDVTDNVAKALWIIAAADKVNATLTMTQACDLVRGLGNGNVSIQAKGKNGSKTTATINVQREAGGKVTLNREDTDSMLVYLLLNGYLTEEFYQTAYSTLSYLHIGREALRFTRTPLSQAHTFPFSISLWFRKDPSAKRKVSSASSSSKRQKAIQTKKPVVCEIEEDEELLILSPSSARQVEPEVDEEGWEIYQ